MVHGLPFPRRQNSRVPNSLFTMGRSGISPDLPCTSAPRVDDCQGDMNKVIGWLIAILLIAAAVYLTIIQ
jgi:hypothetical protein